eukprot:1137380-Pelagomonas_calceolata.AAC.9
MLPVWAQNSGEVVNMGTTRATSSALLSLIFSSHHSRTRLHALPKRAGRDRHSSRGGTDALRTQVKRGKKTAPQPCMHHNMSGRTSSANACHLNTMGHHLPDLSGPSKASTHTHLSLGGAIGQAHWHTGTVLHSCVPRAHRVNEALVDAPDLVPLLESHIPGGALHRERGRGYGVQKDSVVRVPTMTQLCVTQPVSLAKTAWRGQHCESRVRGGKRRGRSACTLAGAEERVTSHAQLQQSYAYLAGPLQPCTGSMASEGIVVPRGVGRKLPICYEISSSAMAWHFAC